MQASRTSSAPLLVALLLAGQAGCNGAVRDSVPFWPLAGKDRTTLLTPPERMEQLRELADRAPYLPADERERASVELAQQIQREGDPLLRERILRTLSVLQTPTASAIVRAALDDEDSRVRITACDLVSREGNAEALSALSEVVLSDTNVDVRIAATRGLRRFPQADLRQTMSAALDDRNPALQLAAIDTLRETSAADYGNDVAAWRQFARGETPAAGTPSIADTLRRYTPF